MAQQSGGAQQSIAKFGKFLSSMVMPNIGAFIAWGFMAAMFISTGWIPNETLNVIPSAMITYLIPVLIAGQGGYITGGDRGRVLGAIAVMGCIAADTSMPMFLGAMIMGPVAGIVIKAFDGWSQKHTPAGFEMLVDNFSLGFIGIGLSIVGFLFIGPFMNTVLSILTAGANALTNAGLLPLLAIIIEPAKVLFLNNAINHGIFTPIATSQIAEAGKSIFYMLEPNPGPGLGVLLAYAFFCKDKKTKQSAPGAIIIHFFGGIHEIYFPYVLMNPKVIVAPIVGNMAAIFWFNMTGAGLVGPASPGSIIAFVAMSASPLLTIIGVAISAGISFAIASFLVRDVTSDEEEGEAFDAAAIKGKVSDAPFVIFACDAGMGSSAMGATRFRNRVQALRPDIRVEHSSVDTVPADADIVVCQVVLSERARKSAPQAQIVTIGNFLDDPNLDTLFEALTEGANEAPVNAPGVGAPTAPKEDTSLLAKVMNEGNIKLGCTTVSREEAIRAAGEMLVEKGYVEPDYVGAMIARDEEISVYMGMGIAIPHGTNEAKDKVKKTGVVLMQYPEGVQWGDEKANLVFGIAGVGNEHLQVLANVCQCCENEEVLEQMKTTADKGYVMDQLTK